MKKKIAFMKPVVAATATVAFAIGILLPLAVLTACTSTTPANGKMSYAEFPQAQELKGTVIPLDTALFRYPFRIRVQGDKAVVMDLHGTDYFCHAFNHPDFHYISSFGKRGESPGEQISVENIRWYGESWWSSNCQKAMAFLRVSWDSAMYK